MTETLPTDAASLIVLKITALNETPERALLIDALHLALYCRDQLDNPSTWLAGLTTLRLLLNVPALIPFEAHRRLIVLLARGHEDDALRLWVESVPT